MLSPRDKPAKALAGIAGAEDEEAMRSCAPLRPVGHPAGTGRRPFGAHVVVRLRRRVLVGQCCEARRPAAAATAPRRPRRAPAARHRRASRGRRPTSDGIAGIAGGDQHVAQEAVAADALDRRARKQRAESRHRRAPASRRAAARADRRARRASPRDAACGELVPRADGQAVVAAIDAVADRRAEFVRDRPLVLDGEVGDAAPRIEPVGRGKGVGRAGVEAGAAGAAMVLLRRVRRRARRW